MAGKILLKKKKKIVLYFESIETNPSKVRDQVLESYSYRNLPMLCNLQFGSTCQLSYLK